MNHADAAQISQLVARAKGGDRQAFDGLVELYAPQVYNISLRITGSRDEAEDCVQETFVRAFSAMRSFRGEAAFFTWLYRVAINVANDAAKRLARNPLVASELARGGADEPPPDITQASVLMQSTQAPPDEAVLADRRRQIILQAIRSLPPHHREVIVLYDLQGLSYHDIARIVGVRVGTVKSRLSRARLTLKERLRPHLELLRG